MSEDPKKFARQIDAFHTAAAIGIRVGATDLFGEDREELVNVYSIDPDGILWAIISSKHSDASGAERFEKLMNYADNEIQRLLDEFTIYGNIQVAVDAIINIRP